jgi:hypothetical protein
MTISLVFPVVLSLAFAAAAVAQDLPATAAPPVAATSAQTDCAKPTARHDHGAERGMPTPKAAAPCGSAKTKAKAKAVPGHDHAKFHKNQ